MTHKLCSVTVLFLGLSVASCSTLKRESDVEPDVAETTVEQGIKAYRTAPKGEEYGYEQKAQYVEDMKRELADIQRDLDRLSVTVNGTGDVVKFDAKTHLNALQEKWRQAKAQLDLAERATEKTWSDVKSGVKQSHEDLKRSVGETRQWLSDKIEP